jgi:hypothetical protein
VADMSTVMSSLLLPLVSHPGIWPSSSYWVGYMVLSTSTTHGPRHVSPDLGPSGQSYTPWSTLLPIVCFPDTLPDLPLTLFLVAQVWSPYLYDKGYSPRYSIAFGVNSAMCLLAVLTCLMLRYLLKKENVKLAQSPEDNGFRFVL